MKNKDRKDRVLLADMHSDEIRFNKELLAEAERSKELEKKLKDK